VSDFAHWTGTGGVAIISGDVAGKSMNLLSFHGLAELEACIVRVLAQVSR